MGPVAPGQPSAPKSASSDLKLDPPGEQACHLMRDGQRMQDELCVDGDSRGTCKRNDATHDDPRPEDLVLWIEPRREEQTEHKRQLQKRHDEHDGSDRDGRIEEPLCYGDEHAGAGLSSLGLTCCNGK